MNQIQTLIALIEAGKSSVTVKGVTYSLEGLEVHTNSWTQNDGTEIVDKGIKFKGELEQMPREFTLANTNKKPYGLPKVKHNFPAIGGKKLFSTAMLYESTAEFVEEGEEIDLFMSGNMNKDGKVQVQVLLTGDSRAIIDWEIEDDLSFLMAGNATEIVKSPGA